MRLNEEQCQQGHLRDHHLKSPKRMKLPDLEHKDHFNHSDESMLLKTSSDRDSCICRQLRLISVTTQEV